LNIKDQNIIYNLFQNALNRISTDFKLSREEYEKILDCVLDNFKEGQKKQQDSLSEYLAKAIRDTHNPIHRLNAVYCLSKIQFNEISLQKVVDVAEDIRARSLED
jgi:hypothetical protein